MGKTGFFKTRMSPFISGLEKHWGEVSTSAAIKTSQPQ